MVGAYATPVSPRTASKVQKWLAMNLEPILGKHLDELVLEITRRIYHTIKYQRREEKGVQSPATTLELGSGSCRDVATLLMEATRHLKIASRFASGYLDCQATRAARGSTHAWTEIYFPNLRLARVRSYDGQMLHVRSHPHRRKQSPAWRDADLRAFHRRGERVPRNDGRRGVPRGAEWGA
jgi:hypothetical protein